MRRLFLSFVFIALTFFALSTRVMAQDPPLSTATPTPTPISSPNTCDGTCGSDGNCQSGLVCYREGGAASGFCRNPSCQSQKSCVCPTTTATPTSTPTPTKTPSPTPKPTVTPTFTPTPTSTEIPEATEEPAPSESPTPISKGINIKGIAIGALVVGLLLMVGGILYLKSKNKNRIPPIGVFDP